MNHEITHARTKVAASAPDAHVETRTTAPAIRNGKFKRPEGIGVSSVPDRTLVNDAISARRSSDEELEQTA